MNFSQFAQKVVPWVAAAATGNIPGLVALAASTVSGVIGEPVAATPDAINGAIASINDPAIMLKMKEADDNFALQMKALGFNELTQLASIAAGDVDSARKREELLAAAGGRRDYTPEVLAYMLTIGFFSVLVYMMRGTIPEDGHDVLLVMVGALGTAWATMMNYFYGSTSSSRQAQATNNKTIADIAKAP